MEIARRYEEAEGPTALVGAAVARSTDAHERAARLVISLRTVAAFLGVAGAVALRDSLVASSSSTTGWGCLTAALVLALVAKAAADTDREGGR